MTINAPRRSTKQLRFFAAVRWVLYVLLILVCFLLQCTGNYTKALYLIPAAVCIAMSEGVLVSCFEGAFCGLLLDISCEKLFCSNAIFMACACVCVSLLFTHLLRHNIINALIVTALAALAQGGLDYLFYYFMWGYPDHAVILHHILLPCILYTLIATVPIYLIFQLIKIKLMQTTNTLAEK